MSSRNLYLTAEQRRSAAAIFRVLTTIAHRLRAQENSIAAEVAWGKAELAAAGFDPVDYLEICDGVDLRPLAVLDRPARILTAAWLGRTRLIDNLAVEPG
jgi:pantoate--beta-alanine ligase